MGNKDEIIKELKEALIRSVEISLKILRQEPVRNFDEFIVYTNFLINKKI